MQDQKAMHFSVMNTECLLNKYLTTYPSANLTGNDFAVTVNLVPMTFIICHSSLVPFLFSEQLIFVSTFLLRNVDPKKLIFVSTFQTGSRCVIRPLSFNQTKIMFSSPAYAYSIFKLLICYHKSKKPSRQNDTTERLDKIYLKCYNKLCRFSTAQQIAFY